MIKVASILAVCGIGSAVGLGVTRGDDPPARPAATSGEQDEEQRGPSLAVTEPPETWGLTLERVSPELAAQLALEPGVGLLVTGVERGSAAEAAGLERYDVVLEVDGEPAGAPGAVLSTDVGRALRVVRRGLLIDVALGSGTPAEAFFSSDSLGPEHPFRRLARLTSLEERYRARTQQDSERLRSLDQEEREAREAAKASAKQLQDECLEQARAFLEANRAKLVAEVEARLTEDLTAPLAGLGLDLAAILPAERLEAVTGAFETELGALKEGTGEALRLVGAEEHEQHARDARERFRRVGNEVAGLASERIARPWREAREETQRHAQRLGAGQLERAQWAAAQVEKIRGMLLGERIECATKRALEELSKQLGQRLARYEAPAPGELEATLDDVAEQIEVMAQRFLARTEGLVATYVDTVSPGRAELAASLARSLGQAEVAARELASSFGAARERHLAPELALDGTWKDRTRSIARAEAFGDELLAATNANRDALRAATGSVEQELREERTRSEDAWSDLERMLGRLASEAESNCWKLDGPHLDGRFPRRPEGRASGDVAMR